MSRWRLSDGVIGVLVALLTLTVWTMLLQQENNDSCRRKGDFLQFYTAGVVANRGETDRLYDQPYFHQLQRSLTVDPMSSLYPPMIALVMSPLARLPYYDAVIVWWAIQTVCFLASGWMLYRMMTISRPWRIVAMLALATLVPVWAAVRMTHLSPLLLLILVGGIYLHRRGNRWWAGLVLSAMAIKPQFAVGLLLWMLLRRDLKTIAAMALGLLLQALVVSAAFGPSVCFTYLDAMPRLTGTARLAYRYSEILEQSFAGIANNLMWTHFDRGARVITMLLVHIAAASAAAILLFRVVCASPPWQRHEVPANARQYEYASAVLFVLLFPPYLLTYDLTLLAVPLVMLWSSPSWRTGIALYATLTVTCSALYLGIGFSLTGVMALWALFKAAQAMQPLCQSRAADAESLGPVSA